MVTSDVDIKEFASELGIDQQDLIQQSLSLYVWSKLREVKTQLFILQKKYQVSTIYEFEQLYETGKIEEESTLEDYQQFDRLNYELDLFEDFLKRLL